MGVNEEAFFAQIHTLRPFRSLHFGLFKSPLKVVMGKVPPQRAGQASRRNQCTAGANIFLGGSLNRRYLQKRFLERRGAPFAETA